MKTLLRLWICLCVLWWSAFPLVNANASSGSQVVPVGRQVLAAKYSPDGSKFAVGGVGFVQLRDANSYKVLWQHDLRKRTIIVYRRPYSLYGQTRVFKGRTEYEKEEDGVKYLAFSPDGTLLATSGSGPTRLWDVKSGRRLRLWPRANADIHSMGYDQYFAPPVVNGLNFWPDASTVALSYPSPQDGPAYEHRRTVVECYNAKTGKLKRRFVLDVQKGRKLLQDVIFIPQGQRILAYVERVKEGVAQFNAYSPLGGEIHIWNRRGVLERKFSTGGMFSAWLSVSPSGLSVAVATIGKRQTVPVKVWQVRTGRLWNELPSRPDDSRSTMQFAPDGRLLVITLKESKTMTSPQRWYGQWWDVGLKGTVRLISQIKKPIIALEPYDIRPRDRYMVLLNNLWAEKNNLVAADLK